MYGATKKWLPSHPQGRLDCFSLEELNQKVSELGSRERGKHGTEWEERRKREDKLRRFAIWWVEIPERTLKIIEKKLLRKEGIMQEGREKGRDGGMVVLGFKPSVSDSKTLALSIRKTQDYLTNIRDQILCFLYYRLWQDFNWEKKDITSLHFMHRHKRKMHFLIFSLHICFLDRKCLNVITLPWLFHMIICFSNSQKSLNTFQQLVWGGESACFVYSIRSLSNP